ncbi:MAG: FG-GAP-like repeat-containing protein [candidate division Zixibacteria bacterium]|nr:FG-GAP-like repeat-containing protein [candidate division Zixibacteria bacterium]
MRGLLLFIRTGLAACVVMALFPATTTAEPIIADHTVIAQFPDISPPAIETIKQDFRLFYGHTSHGSQIVTGMTMIRDENSLYDFNNGDGTLSLTEYGGDLGNAEDTAWVAVTRQALNEPGNTFNVVMWSWCGQVSWATEEGINIYLGAMNQLEQEYPDIKFVYMTGHLDGGGPTGNLYLRNNQIRAYCAANDKILFDFADIESYDPDGVYYPDETDYCNWCTDWCTTHTCPDCGDCAHSQCFNCYQKGKAFWWLMAGMTGWNTQDTIPHVASVTPEQNSRHLAPSTTISAVFTIAMDPLTIDGDAFVVNGHLTGRYQGTITYDDQTRTALFTPSRTFARGELVTAVLTDGITSAEGVPLEKAYVWSFTIAADGGGGVFLSDSVYAVGAYPKQVISIDVNGDGPIDLVTANLQDANVTVLVNDGQGIFTRTGDYYTSFDPTAISGADLDADMDMDIATVDEDGEYFVHISVLKNDGEGGFASPVNFYGGSFALDICAADFNGDGTIDVARSCNDEVTLFGNAGDGSLTVLSSIPGIRPFALAAADFNKDGSIDLAGALGYSDSIAVMMNNGDGTFAAPTKYPSGDYCVDIVAADFTCTGNISLAVVNALDKAITVLTNDGTGVFGAPQVINVPGGPKSSCAADFDGDGDMDIVTTNPDSGTISLLLNTCGTVFTLVNTREVGGRPYSASAADFDGDGDLDLAVTDFPGDSIRVLFNTDREYWGGDANDDGAINVGDAVFIVNYIFRGGPAPQHPEAADANCDGKINVGDAVYIIMYIFRGGPPPCFP